MTQKTYAHSPDRCPSNHWNGGDDTCADCGADLNTRLPSAPVTSALVWTDTYAEAARAEGWCLSERSDGFYEIQRCDDAGTLPDDATALAMVTQAASANSPMHACALLLHGRPHPFARNLTNVQHTATLWDTRPTADDHQNLILDDGGKAVALVYTGAIDAARIVNAVNCHKALVDAVEAVLRCARGELERPVTQRAPWTEAESLLVAAEKMLRGRQ